MSARLSTEFLEGKTIIAVRLYKDLPNVRFCCRKVVGQSMLLKYTDVHNSWKVSSISSKVLENFLNTDLCFSYEYVTLEDWSIYQLEILKVSL